MFLAIDYHCLRLAMNAGYFQWACELTFTINTSSKYASSMPVCTLLFFFIIAECSEILFQ